MKKKEEEKGERWDLLSWGVRAAAVGEGVWAWVRCGGDGGGVGARAVIGHWAKREREGGRGEERAGDANATEQDIN
jgi:hypothetical protein